jgi:uncharacterized protein
VRHNDVIQFWNTQRSGPFFPHDGTGLWVIQVENLEQAQAVVNSSPRVRDGMLADSARVVEWEVHIGRDRFAPV